MERSVYTPGAGHAPPVLAGRDAVLRDWRLMLNDVSASGRARARDLVLVGPRGVGKTVTLTALAHHAAEQGFEVVTLQAVAGQAGLAATLRQRARSRAAERSGPWRRATAAFDQLDSVTLTVAGSGGGVSKRARDAELPQDAGALAQALATLATEVRRDSPNGGLLITVDEMQVAWPADLALLAATLHRLNVDHPSSVVVFAGTALRTISDALRRAGVTHPDRLLAVEPLPATLSREDARYAVVEPARRAGVLWSREAADALVDACNGYPAHLQLFAHATWLRAIGPDRIRRDDVRAGVADATVDLERRTLGPRWDRISDREMEFLAALAVHGGQASTATVAATLHRTPQELSWLRQTLITEGDIYAPRRGRVALAVPVFVRFILAQYETARVDAALPLLPLSQMRSNAGLPDDAGGDNPF